MNTIIDILCILLFFSRVWLCMSSIISSNIGQQLETHEHISLVTIENLISF